MKTALLFPGQGSQFVGMGQALATVSPAAAAAYAEADDALGERLTELTWSGPAADLDLTVNAQPALLATSIAYLRALGERRAAAGQPPIDPACYAGHSMGQYSAMVAAGVLSLSDAVRLVRERGRQMQTLGGGRDGAMAAIIGLDDAHIPELLALGKAHGTVTVANRNSPGQIVISGDRAAVEAAVAGARDLGARRGIVLEGPLPPDTAFTPQARKRFDCYLAQYHDQGCIPFKMLAFDSGVNITLGLPLIRTSPDHGTAFDIAWQGKVRADSFLAAYEMAARLAGVRSRASQ
jgi:[acyl-carrier-protein] S-malonyltransferase